MRALTAVIASVWVTGCAGVPVVSPNLQEKIEWNVSFQQVKASPLSNKGKFIVVGGAVLSVKPLKQNGTRIEVLQLPLASDYEPRGRLTDSHGRFLAFHKEFLDPATIPVGTRVTVVGEVTGSMTLMLDEIDYVYPTLDIASLTIWPPKLPAYWFRPYPYFGAYWGPYWGPYWGLPQWIAWPVESK
ncbi:MAG: putative outer membrane lipoprotein Slp [Nitrospira sp.]|nr:MAG: putative outer membrane lipoprotein Slp [Nitrospira sp.]